MDAVFLDPPYGRGLAERALVRLRAGGWLDAQAVVLVELGRGDAFTPPPGFRLGREHPHGAGRLLRLDLDA
jgi:16S rRNA (guanine966-N2)-methyltransferase